MSDQPGLWSCVCLGKSWKQSLLPAALAAPLCWFGTGREGCIFSYWHSSAVYIQSLELACILHRTTESNSFAEMHSEFSRYTAEVTNDFLQPADASLASQLAHPAASRENEGILTGHPRGAGRMSVLLHTILEHLNLWGSGLAQGHLRDTEETGNSFYLGLYKTPFSLRTLFSIGENYFLSQASLCYLLMMINIHKPGNIKRLGFN